MPYGSKLDIPPTNHHLLQKSQSLNEKCWTIFREKKKSQDNGPSAEKLQDRKSKKTRPGKKREEIGKRNQMTALRFQTGA